MTRELTLADLVEMYAPTLISADAPTSSGTDDAVARTLVSAWQGGPPYELGIQSLRRRPTDTDDRREAHADGTVDDHPDRPFALNRSQLDQIATIHRLAQVHRLRHRRRGRRVATNVAVALAGVALVITLVLPLPRLVDVAAEPTVTSTIAVPAIDANEPTASATTPTTPSPTPSPTPSASPSSAAGNLTCTSQYCLPAGADSWSSQVVAAVIDELDRDSMYSQGGVVTATSLAGNQTGTLLAVTVTAPRERVDHRGLAASDPQLLPRCGDALATTCDDV